MLKTYISPSNTFSLEYPGDWKLEREYGSVALYKKGGLLKKDSQNVLRITPLLADKVISEEAFAAIINIRKKQYRNLEVVNKSEHYIMNFHILKYRQEPSHTIGEVTTHLIQDCWELYTNDRIFSCSFSYLKDEEDTPKVREERETVERILYTLKLL